MKKKKVKWYNWLSSSLLLVGLLVAKFTFFLDFYEEFILTPKEKNVGALIIICFLVEFFYTLVICICISESDEERQDLGLIMLSCVISWPVLLYIGLDELIIKRNKKAIYNRLRYCPSCDTELTKKEKKIKLCLNCNTLLYE